MSASIGSLRAELAEFNPHPYIVIVNYRPRSVQRPKMMEQLSAKSKFGSFWNKTGTSEVGDISKPQKAQSFLKPKKSFMTKKASKKPHNAENCRKGDDLGFLKTQFVANYQTKIEGGAFANINKLSKKVK